MSNQLPIHIATDGEKAFFEENTSHEVLAIEDTFDILKLYKLALGIDGIGINVCFDGKEAIGAIERLKPKAILLDMHLPNVSGEEIYEYLSKHHPGIVVLVITADRDIYSEYLTKAKGRSFLKPLPVNDLREEVKNALKIKD
jgi:DNA-binding NtrC family response regulator